MPKVKGLVRLRCRNCQYRWVPRVLDVRVCPKCGATRWDKPHLRRDGVFPSPNS